MKDGHHFLFSKSKSISHRDISISKPYINLKLVN